MGLYILLFFIPALVVMAITKLYFKWAYSWKEFAVQAGGTLLILVAVFALGGYGQTHDTQLINGVVTKLDAKQETCPTGWRSSRDGFCTEYRTRQVYSHTSCSGSGTSKTCTRHYDTEYNYTYGWERRYFVKSDIPESYEITRTDRQGAVIPTRFASIAIGDAVTGSYSYTNYIKASVDSLFSEDAPTETVPIAYPSVRDYYVANRVIFTGYKASSALFQEWNKSFATVNGNISETGANAIVVVTGGRPEFALALARAWEAHNINDVVTVIGMDGDKVGWVDVRSWSSNSIVAIAIENDILALKSLDTQAINAIIESAILDNFELKSMDEFEYLAEEIIPPMWAMILAAIMLLIITPFVTYIFHKHDVM
jgi:hypothetical protein